MSYKLKDVVWSLL